MKPVKQVIVMRKDLGMRRGKEISQGAHSSIAFLTLALSEVEDGFDDSDNSQLHEGWLSAEAVQWFTEGFTKICVRVDSEAELLDIWLKARKARLEVNLITDSGKTEFGGVPTKTCLAIGPNYAEDIDKITGDLKLY